MKGLIVCICAAMSTVFTPAASGASEMKDMGKVMGMLKPRVQGKADMGLSTGKP